MSVTRPQVYYDKHILARSRGSQDPPTAQLYTNVDPFGLHENGNSFWEGEGVSDGGSRKLGGKIINYRLPRTDDIYAVFLFRDPPSPSFWIRPCIYLVSMNLFKAARKYMHGVVCCIIYGETSAVYT